MYAVFVDDGFDGTFKTKDEAKAHAANVRKQSGQRAYIHKLTKAEQEDLGLI